jgi:hypothetical protein
MTLSDMGVAQQQCIVATISALKTAIFIETLNVAELLLHSNASTLIQASFLLVSHKEHSVKHKTAKTTPTINLYKTDL